MNVRIVVLAAITGASNLVAQARPLRASGTFEVQLAVQPAGADSTLGRMSITKQYAGDITGTGVGTMLTGMTGVPNSGAYVAVERVTGTVHGRKGSFLLQHSGTMNRGAQSLTITVIPDSGTDDLTGISGAMKIIIDGKKHSYEFEYAIPKLP